ncbi:MAG: AraD1 family protein, partial [Burkholderiales bacterium]
MRIIQYRDDRGRRHVGMVEADGEHAVTLKGIATVYELANTALARRVRLVRLARELATGRRVDYAGLLEAGQVLAPLDHPEPARFLITGTGLTHTGSADARHKMHTATHGSGAPESDSMKIFRMGIEAGKPAKGKIGVQPEWFFKGTSHCVVPPGAPLPSPAFALAGAEEPEVVGIYILDKNGAPFRIGFTLGNEFSDHVTEAQNYLFTAHSKLRACSIGPELLLGDLPHEIR